MNTPVTGTKFNPNAEVHVLLTGIMGREKVVRSIFLDPNLKMETVQVPGYGERIQEIANIGPDHVRSDMAMVWKDKQYIGAIGVVKAPGEIAGATRITTTVEGWKTANKLLREFNYHAYGENAAQSWFHNEGVTLPGHEGEPQDIIETFADTSGLQKIPVEQKSSPEFQRQLDELETTMAEDITGFRAKFIEGNASTGTEQKA